MNKDLLTAVKRLVDCVTFRDNIDVSGSDSSSLEIQQECIEDIAKKIRATPEMSSLHAWADRQLAHDYDDPASYEAGCFLDAEGLEAARRSARGDPELN
jgi:hypothetical protein